MCRGSSRTVPSRDPLRGVARGRIGAWWLKQILGLVVVRMRAQQPGAPPMLGGRRCDLLGAREFRQREQPSCAEPLVSWFEVIVIPDACHHHDVYRLACPRAKASLRELTSDLDVRVLAEETVDLGDDFRAGLAQGPGRRPSPPAQRPPRPP